MLHQVHRAVACQFGNITLVPYVNLRLLNTVIGCGGGSVSPLYKFVSEVIYCSCEAVARTGQGLAAALTQAIAWAVFCCHQHFLPEMPSMPAKIECLAKITIKFWKKIYYKSLRKGKMCHDLSWNRTHRTSVLISFHTSLTKCVKSGPELRRSSRVCTFFFFFWEIWWL